MQMTPVGALSSEETIREADAVNTASAEITVETENEDLRTETAKHFHMSDGSFVAVDYVDSVHYKNENGKWTDIDNTLSNVRDGVFDIVNGTVVKRFAKKSEDGFLFSVSDGVESISFTLSDGENTVISAKSGNEALATVLEDLLAENSGVIGNLFRSTEKTVEQMQTSLEKLDKLNGPVSAQLMSLKDKAETKLETLMEQVEPKTLTDHVRRLNYLCCPQAIPAESLSAAVTKKHIFPLDAAFAAGTDGVVYAVSAQEQFTYLQWRTISRYYFKLMVMLLHAYKPQRHCEDRLRKR